MSSPNLHEISQRQGMIALGTNIYIRSESVIEQLKSDLLSILSTTEQRDAVENSFAKLRAIASSLMGDEDYIRNENPFTFKDYLEDLKNVLKIIFLGIPPNQTAENQPDNIDYLRRNFFEALQRTRGRLILQTYVPITQVVRFLRNMEEHSSKPIDHITGQRSHGNLYTLTSVFILVTYAYKEILQCWLKTLGTSRGGV